MRAVGQVGAVGGERIARGRRAFVAVARAGAVLGARAAAGTRRLRDPVRDVLEHVEPRDALLGEQLRGMRLRLLQDRGADVARFDLGALRALDVQHGGLQHAAERGGLLGLALVAALLLFDRLAEIRVEIAAQAGQIGAAGGENALAVGVVRQRVQQVLEGDVGVPARDRFAIGNRQDDFNGGREHGISSRFFDRRSQRVLGGARHRRQRVHLGFGDFPRIHARDAAAVQMHLHHDAVGLG